VGVVGSKLELALGAAQPRRDNGRCGGEGLVVDRQLDGVVARMRDELRGRVFDHAPFGFFGVPFFCGGFGAELHVFLVFDRAAVLRGFELLAFFAFRFFRFVFDRGNWLAGEAGTAHGLRRGGGGEERGQQEDEQEGQELAHRLFIGNSPELL
jgi:hypothetical protein